MEKQEKDIKQIVQQEEIQQAIKAALDTKEDVLLQPVGDRRKLPNVPDGDQQRTNVDRRGGASKER